MNKNYFSMLPNKFFYYDNNSLLNLFDYDERLILIFDYLYCYTNRLNICIFSLEDMITYCGFVPDRNKNRINSQFKSILLKLKELNLIIDINKCLESIKPNQLIRVKLNILDLDNKNNYVNFFQLYKTDRNKILNQSIEKLENIKLLMYYCYLLSRMYKSKKYGDVKPESCYPSYEQITKDTNLADKTITKYNDILVKLDMIRIGNAGLYYYPNDINKKMYESNNVYVLYVDGWESEIKKTIRDYKQRYSERVFVNTREYKDNNKSENGYLSKVGSLINKGKASQEQIDKYNMILESRKDNKITFDILAELDKNKDMLLSDIYWKKGLEFKSRKYYKIEIELGLDDIFGIDWDCYRWVISNYREDKHSYFKDYVIKWKSQRDLGELEELGNWDGDWEELVE